MSIINPTSPLTTYTRIVTRRRYIANPSRLPWTSRVGRIECGKHLLSYPSRVFANYYNTPAAAFKQYLHTLAEIGGSCDYLDTAYFTSDRNVGASWHIITVDRNGVGREYNYHVSGAYYTNQPLTIPDDHDLDQQY